jgi:SAM-dependent methyltransferase
MLSSLGLVPDLPELDFGSRARLSEWMDEPCSYEEFRACLEDLAAVNRLLLAYRPTLAWLKRLVAHNRLALRAEAEPLRIADVGCGQGDMLRRIAAWAQRRSVPVRLFGIDLNPYSARAASSIPAPGASIEWITGDALCFCPPGGLDIIISSLFTHHLADDEIVRFLAWMEREARLGWFINDLHRGAIPYHLFRLLARFARWHPFVQHDGPVSVRRSFRRHDWERYLALAGIDRAKIAIEEFRPGRLCVGRLK